METEVNIEQPAKGPIVLKYGLMAGILAILISYLKIFTVENPFTSKFDWTTVAGFIVAIGAIILAHREFKQNGNGYMSYGQGLGIGTLLGVVSAVVVIIFTFLNLEVIDPSTKTQMIDATLEEMERQNQPEQAIEGTKQFFMAFFYGFLIIGLPFINFIYALIVSLFTQKNNPQASF
jgi:hypothetical protein